NNIAVIVNVGILTGSIPFTCSITGTFVSDAVMTVVSDKGDNLSPTYAPDITAPATNGSGIPKLAPTPIIAIPLVPAAPNDVPVVRAVMANNKNVTTRNTFGLMIANP